jgi:two-component system chemotaxis response regulator CheY
MKTLIVEDDQTSRFLLEQILSPYGPCAFAVNGKEAVEAYLKAMVAGNQYDLICLDIMMPEMDGQAVVKTIREMEETQGILSQNGVKIIMTTALEDPKNVVQAFKSLCDFYLIKPINKGKLLGCIRSLGLIQ